MDSSQTSSFCDKDFLSDVIPYRCPKCGDFRKFPTLRELKRHLEYDHSFKMGCVRPRARAKVFSYKVDDSKPSPRERSLERRLKQALADDKWSKASRSRDELFHSDSSVNRQAGDRNSPLLDTFREETRRLERKLQQAKELEMANKTNRGMSKKSMKEESEGRVFGDGIRDIDRSLLRDSIKSLTDELYKSREDLKESANTLYRSEYRGHGHGLETSAKTPYRPDYIGHMLDDTATNVAFKSDYIGQRLDKSDYIGQRLGESGYIGQRLGESDYIGQRLEEAAERRCHDQQGVIRELVDSLQSKVSEIHIYLDLTQGRRY